MEALEKEQAPEALDYWIGQQNVSDASLDISVVPKVHKARPTRPSTSSSIQSEAQLPSAMSYRYEAASGYPSPRRTRPAPHTAPSTSSRYRAAYSTTGLSVASYAEENSTRSTRDRWQTVQAKHVRFAPAGESPLPAYLKLGSPIYSPAPPPSAHLYSPRAPSLSHSITDVEYDDGLEFPPTPEHKYIRLSPVDAKATKPRASALIPPKHRASYTAISQIVHEMSSLVFFFRCPADLEFEPMSWDQSVPKLTFASKNLPLLEQYQNLENLQRRLGAIASHGDTNVRRARKDAVAQVERALEELKRAQVMIWNKRVYEQRQKRHT